MIKSGLRSKLRLGVFVIAFLFIVELVEYLVGTNVKQGAWRYLAVLAVIGSAPILYYFMHIAQLWSREE